MCWRVRTSKDLGGRPPLASRCISLSGLFFHGDAKREVQLVRIAEGIMLERQAMRAGPVHVELRLVPCLRLITKSCVTSKMALHR